MSKCISVSDLGAVRLKKREFQLLSVSQMSWLSPLLRAGPFGKCLAASSSSDAALQKVLSSMENNFPWIFHWLLVAPFFLALIDKGDVINSSEADVVLIGWKDRVGRDLLLRNNATILSPLCLLNSKIVIIHFYNTLHIFSLFLLSSWLCYDNFLLFLYYIFCTSYIL